MKARLLVVVGVLFSVAAGCRTDPAVGCLERELRRKEDQIYRLQWALEDMQDSMRCAEGDRGATRGSDNDRERPAGRKRDEAARNGDGPPAPDVERGQPSTNVPDLLQRPATSIPSDDSSRSSGPSFDRPPGRDDDRSSLRTRHRSGAVGLASHCVPVAASGDSRQAARIVLNRDLTGGINNGDGSGDQGMLIVVEPRDANGRTIEAPAEVSVVVMDPALDGDASRVARWDFTAAETSELFRRTGSSEALYLATNWPDGPPQHHKLHLFVRYVTADGRRLEAEQPIEVALAGDKSTRWATSGPRAEPSEEPERDVVAPDASSGPPPRNNEHTPRTARRSEEPKPNRPQWSPDRG
jgi:hypothetical protein